MHRFRRAEDARAVGRVLRALPAPLRRRLRPVRFVTGYDPAFLGIHFLGRGSDGRAYGRTSHCVWPSLLRHRPATDRHLTVVLQDGDAHDPDVVLHELGHALDWTLGLPDRSVVPLDTYAARDSREAFATAFQSWATLEPRPHRYFHHRSVLLERDPATATLFRRLAGATGHAPCSFSQRPPG